MEDQDPSANNTRDTECKIPITEGEGEGEGEGEDHHQYFDGRRIHRVPELVRFNKHDKEDYYAPKMVSFGPYYHGLPELGWAEELEHKVLTDFVSSSGKDREFFYCQIFKVIDQIRNCYVGVSRDAFNDGALAEMMLLDASFAIYLMEVLLAEEKCLHFRQHLGSALAPFALQRKNEKYFHFCQHIGTALLRFALQDLLFLENQIPLWVIKLLTKLIYGKEGHMLICAFVSWTSGVNELKRIPGEDKSQPLHLLDATYRVYVQKLVNAEKKPLRKCCGHYPLSRPVTDLKAKGIHFKCSSSRLEKVKFKSYKFYGQLQLPVWIFNYNFKPFFTQMIAYEACAESNTGNIIICYVNFLKSLIVKPEDVKELREKEILFSTLYSDEQIVKLIKEIDNYELEGNGIIDDVQMRIEKHCRSKAKTWIAELINTYLRSPWTFIALVAATVLLCLTFLQTYYTMNLPK